MSEMKPCPKCWQPVQGKVTGGIAAFGCGEYGYDVDCKCGISFSTVCCFETPEEAEEYGVKQWNTRAERTCEKVPGRMHYGERRPKCSECGYGLGDSRWGFCPNCGAKVVSA